MSKFKTIKNKVKKKIRFNPAYLKFQFSLNKLHFYLSKLLWRIDRMIGLIGIGLKKITPRLYCQAKKIKDTIRLLTEKMAPGLYYKFKRTKNYIGNMNRESYDVWLNFTSILKCNLNCEYCIARQYKTGEVKKINIPALIKTLDKTGKIFRINFTGIGEPFLVPNFIKACQKLSRRHYISMNTNLTSSKIKEFAQKTSPKKVVGINASVHIKELERHNLLQKYIENFLLLKQKGFEIIAREVAYPPNAQEIKRYINYFNRRGIKLHFDLFVGEYNNKKYPDAYTEQELELFGFKKKKKQLIQKHKPFQKYCNAGYNIFEAKINGDLYPCAFIPEQMGNIYENIEFRKKITRCPLKFCPSPISTCDKSLLKQALRESKIEPTDDT